MGTMHFGMVSVMGLQPTADARGEQEGLHVRDFLTTPRARIRALASASTPSRPSMPLSHSAYAATESAGVRLGLPAQRPQGADVGQDVPGVAEAVFSGHYARLAGPVLAHHDVREFPGGDRPAASDVEDPPGGAVVRQHEHVGVHDVVDVDVVADRGAILVEVGAWPSR